jgi:predicted lipoprotein with Yx(FWY)xxD motif
MQVRIGAGISAAFAGALVCLCSLVTLAQTAPPISGDTSKGKALVDINGMTLYVFDRDHAGKSNCNAQCAANWLPLIADTDANASGNFSFITRDDGR